MSSAMSHIALPRSAACLDIWSSSSPASEASLRAFLVSLRAEAVATSAAATTSAISGFCLRALRLFAAFEALLAALPFALPLALRLVLRVAVAGLAAACVAELFLLAPFFPLFFFFLSLAMTSPPRYRNRQLVP